jgi:hypothetical protein
MKSIQSTPSIPSMKAPPRAPLGRLCYYRSPIAYYLLFLSLLPLLSGCSSGGEKVTLDSMMRKMSGPSAKELVAWAFDPNDLLKTDQDPLVRAAAVRALGLAGDPTYAPDVTRALLDQSVQVRQDGAFALDRVHDANSAMYLRNRALNDVDQDVRANCCRALRHYPDVTTARVLVEAMADKEFSVRFQSHQSLVDIAGRDMGYDPEDWRDVVAARTLPPGSAPPAEKPWWDWMGVTRQQSGGPAAPAPPQTQPAGPRASGEKPWWDWMGVTRSQAQPASPQTQPAQK